MGNRVGRITVAYLLLVMIQSEGEKPSKKPRLGIFNPFVVATGAVAASRSSSVEDTEYLAELELEDVETDTIFFPDNARGDPDAVKIGQNVHRALKRPHDKEERLRNAVYTELKLNHGINFPASSEHWNLEVTLRSKTSMDHRYKENDLAHLLHEFHRQRAGHEDSKEKDRIMPRLLHGLNVTTTSLPDMTVLREKYLYFGEFKNSDKYTNESAAKQCTLYLYALLYFFRVRLGLDVKAVFGFWVCGPGCFTRRKQYSVGFVRLSAPRELGGSLVPEVFSTLHGIDSVAGIQRLICFLKIGNIVELEEQGAALQLNRRIPALLSLPGNLWESPFLVTNGSASMVFRGFGDQILGLLHQFRRPIPYFEAFLSSAKSLFVEPSTIFYLKIRLKDTTLRQNPALTATVILKKYNDSFQELYPIDPIGDGDCGLFLMNDCGTSLRESEKFKKLGFPAFCACFAAFWKNTVSLSDGFLHGDALPHNIVYNESTQKLVLIDADEGTVGTNAHKRVVEQDDELQYAYLRYPNFLRAWKNRRLYTELQLVASFLLLAEMFEQTVEQDKTAVKRLQIAAEAANVFLKRTNEGDPMVAYGSEVSQSVYGLVELFEETLEAKP